jgi:hypothetical protein
MRLGQQRGDKNPASVIGMMESELVGEDRFARPWAPLDYV